MAEEFADFALWPDGVENDLDIPEDLRNRMKAWVRENTAKQAVATAPWPEEARLDHDRRGYALSQELQAVLGDAYFVTYHFETVQVRSEVHTSPTE